MKTRSQIWVCIAFVLTLALIAPAAAQDDPKLDDLPLAVVHTNGTIELFGLPAEQDGQALLGGSWNYIDDLVWSPDGEVLVFADYGWPTQLLASVPAGSPPFVLVENLRASGMPVSFLADGRVVYAEQTEEVRDTGELYGPVFKLNAIEPRPDAEPEQIGTFIFAPGCGGGSMYPADWRYWDEAGFQGNDTVLAVTEYGIVHNGDCLGRGIALAGVNTGEDVILDSAIHRAAVAPDGSRVLGIRGDALGIIDLATGALTTLATIAVPDQVAWGAPGSGVIFYSVRWPSEADLVSAEERDAVAAALGMTPDSVTLPVWSASIHRYDLETGADEEIFIGGYFAIGRMIATPDGAGLIFSVIPNMWEWAAAIYTGELDPTGEAGIQAGRALLQTMLFYLDLESGVYGVIGTDQNQPALNTARWNR